MRIIEAGLDCMVIFIEMGRDEGRAKRMRDLIELDFLEVLETLEKKGGLK